MVDKSVENENKASILPFDWMIRPCEMYKDEYSDCTSMKSRFQQYFVFGETTDCTQWKRDLDNCQRWFDNGNIKAREELIASEKLRQSLRLLPHLQNDVWEDRKQPPEDWNKPLPEWMQKEQEISFLAIKANELKEGNDSLVKKDSTLCIIS